MSGQGGWGAYANPYQQSPTQMQDLGQFQLTTQGDITGLNTGNLTSYIDTSTIKVAKFQLYRLVLNVSAVPNTSTTPKVIQTTRGQYTSGTPSTLNLTFSKATTLGNTIVVVGASESAVGQQISAVTLGGVADNFGTVSAANITGGDGETRIDYWVDPDCAVASTALVLSVNNGGGTSAWAYEIQGITQSTIIANVVDTAMTGTAASNATSVATSAGITSEASDIAVGIAMASTSSLSLALGTAAKPVSWTQAPQQQNTSSGSFPFTAVAGYTTIPTSGSSVEYAVSWSGLQSASASFVAFTSASITSPLPAQLPFQIYLDSQLWDNNQTTAGVGFTYDPNTPMKINQGQRLSVLWTNLPTTVFQAFESSFIVTAFFQYDPTLPGNQF